MLYEFVDVEIENENPDAVLHGLSSHASLRKSLEKLQRRIFSVARMPLGGSAYDVTRYYQLDAPV